MTIEMQQPLVETNLQVQHLFRVLHQNKTKCGLAMSPRPNASTLPLCLICYGGRT